MNRKKNVAFLSTYPPRGCGLATFTEDLVNGVSISDLVRPCIIAVTAGIEDYDDPRVEYRLHQHERTSYLWAARWANHNVDLLVIEHEYGIFGGESGEFILDLVNNLEIPFVVTTHTVLESPTSKQQDILRVLGQLSVKVVTMAQSSAPILTGTYGIAPDKIVVIPHGVPSIRVGTRKELKAKYGLKDKLVISSFGLLSPNKGLEYGIEAVAQVAVNFENVVYLVLGKTHPDVKQKSGESYRQSLMDLAEDLGVKDKIQFVDKYLTKEEVITYLNMSDIYMTPYLSKEQAVSGTLAYAVGCGRVVVSTPYPYAREMLGGGRGMLADFRDSEAMAGCLHAILSNPLLKKQMERKTFAVGWQMTWEKVGSSYASLFMEIMEESQMNQETALIQQYPALIHSRGPAATEM